MNLLFDEESQKLILQAKKVMLELKHPYVGSEHLFLAILNFSELSITNTLNSYGITYDKFKDELIRIVGLGSKENNWFLFTPLLKRIINNATYYSKDSNRIITPHSLLVSILQEGDGVANRILIGMNIDLNVLYDKFMTTNYLILNDKLLLDDLGINMNKAGLEGKYDPVIGRDRQIEKLIQILLRKNKNNPLLIGEAGVGKTAIVEELAHKIALGDVPLRLKNKMIYNVSMSVLVAGTKYRGEFEERINKIIKEVINNKNIILFIDEVHTLVGAGGAEGAIDASNIIKPYLARGDFQIIGATTSNEYSNFIEKDKALDRRFQKVYVAEPNDNEVINILKELSKIYGEFHNVRIPQELLNNFVELSNKYLKYGRQPDKVIDLLDEVCTYCSSINNTHDIELNAYEKEIKVVEQKKNDAILKRDFKNALLLRDKELKIRNDYNELLLSKNSQNMKKEVQLDDIYKIIFDKTGILLGDRFLTSLSATKKILKKKIFGQNNVITKAFSIMEEQYFKNSEMPLSFLLVGKSGVGKTYFVKTFAENMCDSNSFIKIDLNEYSDTTSINKLVGTPLGYAGYNEKSKILEEVRLHPFSIILFKNIDSCASNVLDILCQMLDTGYISNSHGEKIWFSNTIVFFTSSVANHNFGFKDKPSGGINNLIYKRVSNILEFDDIDKNTIIKQLYNRGIKQDNTDRILEEIDYKNNGYKNFDEVVNKYLVN